MAVHTPRHVLHLLRTEYFIGPCTAAHLLKTLREDLSLETIEVAMFKTVQDGGVIWVVGGGTEVLLGDSQVGGEGADEGVVV